MRLSRENERRLACGIGIGVVLANAYTSFLGTNPALVVGNSSSNTSRPPPTKAPRAPKEIDIVLAHCHEDLSWIDQFQSCHRVHFHIYSKCGDHNLPAFQNVSDDCATIHSIDNCGTQEYAFFYHIYERYEDRLAPMTAFLQAGALSENPHVVHDILAYLPGTTFAGLARHVRAAWHVQRKGPAESALQNKTAPLVFQQKTWLNDWRAMFLASRSALERLDRSLYLEFTQQLCSKTCKFVNCAWEHWFAPTFGCAPVLFERAECERVELGFARSVIPEDYLKDSTYRTSTALASKTWRVTCGNRTILHASSALNGMLTCVETSSHDNHTSVDWETLLADADKENMTMNYTEVEWGVRSRWKNHEANSDQQAQLASNA
jgi:hypothetical protein